MPTNTYVALDKATVTTATPSITFTGISGAYTDLVIVASIKADSTTIATPALRFNGDTTSNYSATWLYGNGTSALSSRASTQTYLYTGDYVAGVESTNFSTFISHIMNYSNTTTFKTVLSRNSQINSADGETGATVGLWRKTPEAISTILYTSTNGANFAVGSTFSLYGIAASSVGAKATGGIISSDSQYYYHTFNTSGTFTPTQSLSTDYLVVAGGGGGCMGGGGAGGFQTGTGLSVTATGYSITVGAGGAGGNHPSTNGSNGSNSVFSSITSTGGGGGAKGDTNGLAGGSGGGGGGNGSATSTGGAASPAGQGNAGGGNGGFTGSPFSGGGGGGAGAVGGNATANDVAGNGGNGLSSSYSGSSVTYAGGGGSSMASVGVGTPGTGGTGGGANGSTTNTGNPGTVNTGGGGGGAAGLCTGGTGGSGVVIIRYLKA